MSEELTHLLYVDDDADIRAIAMLALETVGGFHVRTCASGAEALDALKTYQPQLVLMDVMMPEMDGPTTLRNLRSAATSANIPVVFMTAKTQRQETDELMALGAIGVIPKPFDPMELPDRLRDVWRSFRHAA